MDLSIIYTDIDCAQLQRSALVHAVFSVYLVFPNRTIDQRIRPSERRTVVENPGSEVRCSRGNRFSFGARPRQSPAAVTNSAQEELVHHASPVSMSLEAARDLPTQLTSVR